MVGNIQAIFYTLPSRQDSFSPFPSRNITLKFRYLKVISESFLHPFHRQWIRTGAANTHFLKLMLKMCWNWSPLQLQPFCECGIYEVTLKAHANDRWKYRYLNSSCPRVVESLEKYYFFEVMDFPSSVQILGCFRYQQICVYLHIQIPQAFLYTAFFKHLLFQSVKIQDWWGLWVNSSHQRSLMQYFTFTPTEPGCI